MCERYRSYLPFLHYRYSTINAIASNNPSFSNYGVPIKKTRTEEEYFEDDDDEPSKYLYNVVILEAFQ